MHKLCILSFRPVLHFLSANLVTAFPCREGGQQIWKEMMAMLTHCRPNLHKESGKLDKAFAARKHLLVYS
jgi:hypothetical protein